MALEIQGIPTGNVYTGDSFDITVHDTNSNSPGFDTVSVSWTYDRNKIYIWEEFAYHTYIYHVVAAKAGTTVLTANYNGNSKSFTLNIKSPNVVTFNANGGSVSTSTMTARGSVTLPTPTHDENHIFMGWFTATSFGDKIGNGGDTVPVDSNFTAYAQWLYLKYYPLKNNERYIEAQTNHENIQPKGIMVHSTGANNADLKRYVQPDDGLLGVNGNNNHWNVFHPFCEVPAYYTSYHASDTDSYGRCLLCRGKCACVHAFIGKLADGTVAVYQTLPWNNMGWHSGSGSLGQNKNANKNGFIGFEICEDGYDWNNTYTDADWEMHRPYVDAAYYEAVKLCAYLCKLYNIEPVKSATGGIVSHKEGNQLKIASQHVDPDHWFEKYNHSMDQFREDVRKVMG